MKLHTIKLNGFKSFADQTTCKIPSQMVGIVGPNGCGKSNIIDGIRWVLGEGRAQELRGESMQDVIFNGSTQRKPAHRSSVELIFENQAGMIAGTWASYQEISVKRTLDRNNKSAYFINQTEVRRKDIQDMFLGTGLGPRAYAIIGQGMINRLLEAKPEELRVFLEEAANISKYKERRKESLQRISSTQENLARLHDIIHELSAQKEKLSEQAIKAEQYLTFQEQQKKLEQKIALLNWQQTQAQQQKVKIALEQQQLIEAQQQQQLTQFDEQLYDARLLQEKNQQQLQQIQQSLHDINQHIMQLENQLALEQQQLQQLQDQLTQTTSQLEDLNISTHDLERTQHEFDIQLEELIGLQETLQEQIEILEEHIEEQNHQNNQSSTEFDDLKISIPQLEYKLTENQQQYHVKQQELRKIETILEEQEQKNQALLIAPDVLEKNHLQGVLLDAQRTLQKSIEELNELAQELPALQPKIEKIRDEYHEVLTQESQFQGKLTALQSFDLQSVNCQDNHQKLHSLKDWLTEQELGHLAPLSELITPEKGWERCISKVLKNRFSSVLLPKNSYVLAFSQLKNQQLPHESFALVSQQYYDDINSTNNTNNTNLNNPSLFQKITWNEVPNTLIPLQNQWKEILAQKNWLGELIPSDILSQENHINQQGHQWSEGVLSFNIDVDETALRLERQQQINDLHKALEAQKLLKVTLSEQLQALVQTQKNLQLSEQTWLKQKHDASKQEQETLFLLQKWQQDFEHFERLQSQKKEGQKHLSFQQTSLEEALALLEDRFMQLDEELSIAQQKFSDLTLEKEEQTHQKQQKIQQLQQLKFKQKTLEQQTQEIEKSKFAKSALLEYQIQQIDGLNQEIKRLNQEIINIKAFQNQQLQQLKEQEQQEHKNNINNKDFENIQDMQETKEFQTPYDSRDEVLQQLLQKRFELEEQLELHKKLIQNQESHIQQLNGEQHQLRQKWYQQQNHVRQLMVDLQGFEGKLEQMKEQCLEIGLDLMTINLAEHALYLQIQDGLAQGIISLPQLMRDKNQVLQQKQALGVVNLLSIEEIKAVQERLQFLVDERTDIENAISDLENAIITIDNESREVLQHTFDTVNENLGLLFPKLFGGGCAYLTQIGEDILDAGVQVMAQPPGKKNSSIYLLSGGEKALTATALVFSFFMLNPAPFCLLDEVDAPLDDANTHRLFEMVASMSDKTQFVFISHNKIAMELANHLIGVTMAEKGVSRVVSVDLQEFQV